MTDSIGLTPYLLVGALLFVCGAVSMATKRNALGILMGVEAVLYRLFGAHAPGRTAAYFALAAIFLAFLCSAVGFSVYTAGFYSHETEVQNKEKEVKGIRILLGNPENAEKKKELEEQLKKAE